MKVVRGTPKHLSKTSKLNKFTYLMINLPFKCNYRCSKCFNLKEINIKKELINLEDRKKLIYEFKKLGGRVVVIAGEGEPTFHPETKSLLSLVSSLDMIPIIYTNGSILNSENIDFYKKHKVVLVIAFDSLIPEKYSSFTGTKGQFEKVLENIKNTIKNYKDLEYNKGKLRVLSIAVNTTVSSSNRNEVEKIKQFWGDDVYFICNPLVKLGNAVKNWNKMMDEKDKKNKKEMIERLSESGGPLTFGNDGICGYSKWGIGVSPSGDYMTCAYTCLTDGLLGNIKTKNIKQAFEYKRKIENEQYKKYGIAPCLIRSKFFPLYIEELKNLILRVKK